jgi:DNA-binding transcriptional MerR regulator
MRIGELSRRIGVSTDTVRFYERSGWLPRPARRDNDYREYAEADAEHLRLLIDLRRLDVPLEDAARIASWCHSGHCAASTDELPRLIAARRAAIAERIAGLQELDARLASLDRHVAGPRRQLTVVAADGPCCDAAEAVVGSVEGGCACCAPAASGAWKGPAAPGRRRPEPMNPSTEQSLRCGTRHRR